jgi:hypothetical protein
MIPGVFKFQFCLSTMEGEREGKEMAMEEASDSTDPF